jgi:hypothetical protein
VYHFFTEAGTFDSGTALGFVWVDAQTGEMLPTKKTTVVVAAITSPLIVVDGFITHSFR